MAGFLYAPYNACQGYGNSGCGQTPPGPAPPPPPRNKQPGWKQSKPGDYPPEPPDYLDNYQRAQLKAILSQVNPNLTPRLRKANTKEVGVQVNPRVDAGVQCSLGPRTLRPPPPPSPPPPCKAAVPARLARPLAVYSPGVDRRLFSLPQGGRLPRRSPAAPQAREGEATPGEEEAEKREPEVVVVGEVTEEGDKSSPGEAEEEEEGEEPKRSVFQFLEQKYGYFHCKDCKTRWESAYVWCISGSNKVCSKTRCSCPQKKRHIDLKRPHRQELCGRCKDKRLSCDNTYSFKYIV
ncbi:protein ZAR1-like isoform X2 [Ascaphus truei]|uniref:protein ZAR1-like isoform X2 n=1 Tax=Ascaphus truei TaxID=8439 RepID=UPI003F5A6478